MSAKNSVSAENNGIEAQSKQREIVAMFDEIAHNYDLANRILSFGIDTRWRKEACEKAIKLCDKQTLDILDIACGTGDMIATWLKVVKYCKSVESGTKNDSCGSIFDEKSGLCSHERGNKTKASIDEASGKLPDLSQKDNALCSLGALGKIFLEESSTLNEIRAKIERIFVPKVLSDDFRVYGAEIAILKSTLLDLIEQGDECLNDFNALKAKLGESCKVDDKPLKGKGLFMPLRFLLTGAGNGPHLDILYPHLRAHLKIILRFRED